ncbi:hypothetical protein ALQ95_200194 [Pseudomonas syringae pv. ribicola]|uniref:Uncharacterized protein n=1 Tax=Pseudomonas syringae pv. ribicola TaxID=55398 RepID=A0A3M2VQC5_PSESI|nr:hypothetical protein ALQ95_200194 [Pseudomonas syringae pv. ribicola]
MQSKTRWLAFMSLLRFRRLLETHQLTRLLFETINQHLASRGLLLKEGTIVDATLIAAPPSVKNREGKRDPEMHQARNLMLAKRYLQQAAG